MIQGSGKGQLHADIQAGSHSIVSGLSEALGGKDEGPDPHALLEASLAACTILTVQLYANRKAWDLKGLDVTIRIDAEGKEGTRMTREIRFAPGLDAEQIERLTEIANKCPIHRLLSGSVTIDTKILG